MQKQTRKYWQRSERTRETKALITKTKQTKTLLQKQLTA